MAGINNNSDKKIIMLLEDIDLLALKALTYAKENSKDIVAFSAITNPNKEGGLRANWEKINGNVPYIIRYSQSKGSGALLSEYIDSLDNDKEITVLVPLAVMKSWWQRYLNRSYIKRIKHSLSNKSNVVLVKLPHYLDKAA